MVTTIFAPCIPAFDGTPQWSKSFVYDPMGNRSTSQSVTLLDTVDNTYTSNELNQITAVSGSWGGGANTLASSLLYDQSGNLTKWTSTGTGAATPAHTECARLILKTKGPKVNAVYWSLVWILSPVKFRKFGFPFHDRQSNKDLSHPGLGFLGLASSPVPDNKTADK